MGCGLCVLGGGGGGGVCWVGLVFYKQLCPRLKSLEPAVEFEKQATLYYLSCLTF